MQPPPPLAGCGVNDNESGDEAWWLSGYCLPPPGHLGAHSVPVTSSKDRRLDVFTTPTKEARPTPARTCFDHFVLRPATSAATLQAKVPSVEPSVPMLSSVGHRRGGAVLLPSISSLISISPPTAKRSSADAVLDLHEITNNRLVKQFKLV
ncbi:hypothetical protein AaE_003322 [Aphanomyces astaci]|uniref:Uncharacterized protein n=1 Tax=Aphanomyces astaci TaxID=112090 RepID=A0A6A5ALC9_APHAT|nr:hypothetical protein AaE_003322 [Aphanomyces astaci]